MGGRMNTIDGMIKDLESDETVIGGCTTVGEIVIALKSLKERKKGRWLNQVEYCEKVGMIPSGLGFYEWCSNCDCAIDVREFHRNDYNYCPNCGARMEVKE